MSSIRALSMPAAPAATGALRLIWLGHQLSRAAWRLRAAVWFISQALGIIHVVNRYVVAGDGAADAARAKCHGRHHAGGQAGGAQGAHRIDHDAENRLLQPEFMITLSSWAWITSEWPRPPKLMS